MFFVYLHIHVSLVVCLFVGIQPEKLCSASCVGREVNPLGVIILYLFLQCFVHVVSLFVLFESRVFIKN